jgi:hypothetical protein
MEAKLVGGSHHPKDRVTLFAVVQLSRSIGQRLVNPRRFQWHSQAFRQSL